MNLVKGTVFSANFDIFGSYNPRTRKAKYLGSVLVKAKIINESYGLTTAQHTFTFEVLESSDKSEFQIGKKYKKKGRNIYPCLSEIHEQPANYDELANEKIERKKEAIDYAETRKSLLD